MQPVPLPLPPLFSHARARTGTRARVHARAPGLCIAGVSGGKASTCRALEARCAACCAKSRATEARSRCIHVPDAYMCPMHTCAHTLSRSLASLPPPLSLSTATAPLCSPTLTLTLSLPRPPPPWVSQEAYARYLVDNNAMHPLGRPGVPDDCSVLHSSGDACRRAHAAARVRVPVGVWFVFAEYNAFCGATLECVTVRLTL